ncbi:GATA zinc finger [Diaporthe helianthi]|uniref:GATA zinc finger n=1 Tax=Diaporthe helianthi TaxID=158607 RepID=A0A2P5I6X6_DIAHE|nr:GATA zinc finger [Diaporthe helianthi]
MSSFPLPIRPATPPQQQQVQQQQPQPVPLPPAPVGSDPLPSIDEEGPPPVSPRPAAAESIISQVAKWVDTTSGVRPTENHQFWISDSNIAENLFTIHRSTKHLFDFTSSIIGNNESFMGQRPIPVMSDGDILFMTQLSSDISRGVGSISAIRHHGLRAAKKRKTRPDANRRDEAFKRLHSGSRSLHHHHSRHHHDDHQRTHPHRAGSSNSEADGAMSCWKCGRTDTPEWRNGPDGEVLCNACGLVYAKQKRKGKSKVTHHSHHSQSGPS